MTETQLMRSVWRAMRFRCYSPKAERYPHYGGRGITVCERWRNSYENFLADMGPRPSRRHSIDRIDNNDNYEPGNCRWATREQQHRNRTDTKLTASQVRVIRKFLNKRVPRQVDLAWLFAVSHAEIKAIRANRIWRGV